MKSIRSASVLASSLVFASYVVAQPTDGAKELANILLSRCMTGVPALLNRPDFTPILNTAPIDTDKICRCTEARFLADIRLREYLNADEQVVIPRLKDEQVKAYSTLRFTSAMFSCMVPEIDQSLEKSIFKK